MCCARTSTTASRPFPCDWRLACSMRRYVRSWSQLLQLFLARSVRRPGRQPLPVRGLPQGSALSPLLSNLVLAQVDAEVVDQGFALVRYADDIAVVCDSEAEAWEAARAVSVAVERIGMRTGRDTDSVMGFESGFTFLGEDFGPKYPPMPSARVVQPDRRTLYVGVQGSRARIQAGRIIVESADDADLLDVPTSRVRSVVVFGSVGVSAGLRSWAMDEGVDIVFASRRGNLQGVLRGAENGPRADRLVQQLRATEGAEHLPVCREIVSAKLAKQIVVLRRFGRRDHAEQIRAAVHDIQQLQAMLPQAQSRAEIMGLEGAAAARYFPAYGALFPESLRFENRSRQPPRDVANSALSFLYTVIGGECVTACWAAGLEPILGVLHAPHERRPSLALDLLEEFRPYVVDQVVLALARSGSLTSDHGRIQEDRPGVMLTAEARERLLDAYEQRMCTKTSGAVPGLTGSLRRHLYLQATALAGVVVDPARQWQGLAWR